MIFAHLRNCANDQMLKPESQIQGFDPQMHMKKEIELKFKIKKPSLIRGETQKS
jgi:hypothetical protein